VPEFGCEVDSRTLFFFKTFVPDDAKTGQESTPQPNSSILEHPPAGGVSCDQCMLYKVYTVFICFIYYICILYIVYICYYND